MNRLCLLVLVLTLAWARAATAAAPIPLRLGPRHRLDVTHQDGTWTNMGEQRLPRDLETYLRSARLVHHSARRFDPHARVFVSLTHHWTKQSHGRQTNVIR